MKITIAAIGKMKNGAVMELYNSYKKRIPWEIKLHEVEEKRALPTDKLKEREAELLLAKVPIGAKKIVLDEGGKLLTSRELAGKLRNWQDEGYSDVAFLIGGADGHAKSTVKGADLVLSFGKMTWPHMLVRVMLIEQIYRSHTILTSHPYHRD